MSGPITCPQGKPYVAYLTSGHSPLRLQAEAEDWGRAEMETGGRAEISPKRSGTLRCAIYCCHQQPVMVTEAVPMVAGQACTLQLFQANG